MTSPVHTPKPVPDRPLSMFDIADGSFAILRGRPRTVATITAVFVLPSLLLSSWLSREVYADFDFSEFTDSGATGPEFQGFGLFTGGNLVAAFFQYALLPFLGVALTHLVLGWREGIDRSAGDCLKFTLRKAHIILAAWLLSKVVQILTIGFGTPISMLVAPVLAAEDVGPVQAISRSYALARRRYGTLLGLLALVVLVHILLTYATQSLPTVIGFLLGSWGWIAFFALSSIGTAILGIFGVGVSVLTYIDLRNRTEGADLIRRLEADRHRV